MGWSDSVIFRLILRYTVHLYCGTNSARSLAVLYQYVIPVWNLIRRRETLFILDFVRKICTRDMWHVKNGSHKGTSFHGVEDDFHMRNVRWHSAREVKEDFPHKLCEILHSTTYFTHFQVENNDQNVAAITAWNGKNTSAMGIIYSSVQEKNRESECYVIWLKKCGLKEKYINRRRSTI